MFGGSMVAVVTPMTADGAIDFQAWEQLLRFHADEGTDALVVGGTTGESPTLTEAELGELVRRALRQLPRAHADRRGRRHQFDGAHRGARARAVVRWRGWFAGGDALLQQADAGRPLPAFSRGRRGCERAGHRLQRAVAHRCRSAARDGHPPGARTARRRSQGSDRRSRACAGRSWPVVPRRSSC